MPYEYPIDVTPNGSILLGPVVSCDGFHYNRPYRIQTHVHLDHLNDFETSKGFQKILLSDASKALLEAEMNADIPYRDNIVAVALGSSQTLDGCRMTLHGSGHILGAVQVAVTIKNGPTVGYSGDFQWPLDDVIQADALVIDSTCGALDRQARYSQQDADEALIQVVLDKLRFGPIFLTAHRGTLQRAIRLLGGLSEAPLIAKPKICRQVEVYRRWGYGIDPVHFIGSEIAQAAMREGRFIRLFAVGESLPIFENATQITLTKFMVPKERPIIELADRAIRIGMSEHADLEGTLEYVKAVSPNFVICDSSREGHAAQLAIQIKNRLGIEAVASVRRPSYEWGE
jgi:putative mRNA 3-end processing factor